MAQADYKSLKIFVYFMGMVLVGGIVVITFSIFKFFNLDPKKSCIPVKIPLEQKILNAVMEKDKLIVLLTEHDHSQTILVIDYCDGSILNRIDFTIKAR